MAVAHRTHTASLDGLRRLLVRVDAVVYEFAATFVAAFHAARAVERAHVRGRLDRDFLNRVLRDLG